MHHLLISDDRLRQQTITNRVLRSVGVRTGRTRSVRSPPKIDIYNLDDDFLAPLDQQQAYRAHFQRHPRHHSILFRPPCPPIGCVIFADSCCMHRLNWLSLKPDARLTNGVSGPIYPPTPCLRNHTFMLQLCLYTCPRMVCIPAGHAVTCACNAPFSLPRNTPQQTDCR